MRAEWGKVCALGPVRAEQAVGFVVETMLPRTVGVGEIDLDARDFGEAFVLILLCQIELRADSSPKCNALMT